MLTKEQSAALPEDEKLRLLKAAKGGAWYDEWRPYCLVCPTTIRMSRQPYGFHCRRCGNMIGFNLTRLADSPLNCKTK